MIQLPRLLAYLDQAIAERDDLGIRLAAVAAVGPEVALVARYPGGTTAQLTALASRCVANAKPSGAQVLVTGRVDVALATGAAGVIHRSGDLPIAAVRTAAVIAGHPGITFLSSVHSMEEARAAAGDSDGLIVGNIWSTNSHPGRPGRGLGLLAEIVELGLPTWAIGGVTPARAREARAAGAYGVAAIGAVFHVEDSYRAARALLDESTGR